MNAVREWAEHAVRYRLFLGFGAVWFAIVSVVTPVGSLLTAAEPVNAAAPVPEEVRGTLGAVSAPAPAAANALAATVPPTPSDVGPADYAGFEPSVAPQDFSGGGDAGGTGEPEPGPCSADEPLPAPVATTVVGALGGAEDQLGSATGQAPPADASDSAGQPLGCGEAQPPPEAPSLDEGGEIGGLSPVDMLLLLLGLGPPAD